MITWDFGDLLSSGFADEEQTGFAELTPDAGVPFRRQVFTDVQNLVTGRILLNLADYTRFKSFYRNDTAQGTKPFKFYDCRFDVERTARFIGKPSYSASSNHFDVSLSLSLEQEVITREFNLITEDGLFNITTEAGDQIIVEQKFEV